MTGVYTKLPYLKSLGIGVVWLSPILKSPMVDFGYDVSNFREIDPTFGTMDDFDNLVRRARKLGKIYLSRILSTSEALSNNFFNHWSTFNFLGLRVMMDYVPNHTSDQHEWFQKSIKKIAPYTDYYMWKDAKYVNGVRHPPTNWVSSGNSSFFKHRCKGGG